MLQLTIPANEVWDEEKQEFVYIKEQTLRLEHSLVSLSKWESKWCKPFYATEEKTYEETIDYIKCMTLNQHIDPDVYRYLTNQNIKDINEYIAAPMTATTFSDNRRGGFREHITSELIYYWMIALNIPPEYQKWHLNRLLTLIRVCEIKSQPPKKMSKGELMRRNSAINAARLKKYNTTG